MFFQRGQVGRNDWWLYLIGFVIVFIGYSIGQVPLMAVLMSAMSKDENLDMSDLMEFQENPDFSTFGIDSNIGFLLLLMMFVVASLFLYLVVRFLHKKPWLSIITANSKLKWSKILFGFGLWFVMTIILEAINGFMHPEAYEFTFNASKFLPLLLLAIFILPIQTSFEEFLFRGYLMQGIGMYSAYKWIPWVITSVLFGLIHGMNPEVKEFGFITMQVYYISAGLFLGLLAIMDDSIELSLGVHAATNMYGALMVGYNGAAIQTDTVFRTDDIDPTFMTIVFFVSATIFYFICAKKYNWTTIRKVLDPINLNEKMNMFRTKCLLMTAFIFSAFLSMAQNTWQQKADYKMEIDFDVESHQFNGVQKIKYENNSPDDLTKVFYHLYFNAFQPNSMMDWRSRTIQDPDGRVGDRIYYLKKNEIGYHNIKRVLQDGKECTYNIEGTILEVNLNQKIKSGDRANLELEFESQVPVQIRRSGRDNKEGISYSMSQWYPKLCEYDYQGWHANPYVGREFHGVWGSFDVKINIDSRYIVAATGQQKSKNKFVSANEGKRKWHYKADDVHDFVWAADPDYSFIEYQAKDGVEMQFFFQDNEETNENWNKLPAIMDEALSFMNKRYGKYPYPVYKFIQGGDGGMEYPMATLITGERSLGSLVGVCVHEWMHSWYQMVLATNEALYPWMDEGFTSFGTTETMDHLRRKGLLGSITPQENPFEGAYNGYINMAQSGREEALSTHADHYQTNRAYGVGSYTKGQVFLKQLEYIIGSKDFDKVLLSYFDTWKFRHPTDVDFIRVAEKISGLELDWYREYWVNSIHKIDYGVFLAKQDPELKGAFIFLSKEDVMPMPLDVKCSYSDGSSEIYNIPLTVMRGNKSYDYEEYKVTIVKDWPWTHPAYSLEINTFGKELVSVEIDPSRRMADVNRGNNFWRKTEE